MSKKLGKSGVFCILVVNISPILCAHDPISALNICV
jgi:hypothetical protein